MPSSKLKPTHPWKMYARPLPILDPSLRDAVLLPPAPGAPLWDCPVPLGVYDFLTVKELSALSCASRALSGWLAPGTVRLVEMWIVGCQVLGWRCPPGPPELWASVGRSVGRPVDRWSRSK